MTYKILSLKTYFDLYLKFQYTLINRLVFIQKTYLFIEKLENTFIPRNQKNTFISGKQSMFTKNI